MNLNLKQITSKLSPRGWAAVGGSALVAVLFIYLLFSLASAPSYTTIMAGVNPAQTGKITSALSTAGVPYQLQNNGTAIAVETDKEAQARVALAQGGLLSGTGSSATLSSLSGSGSLGESNFQQQLQYQSALESQLDTAIENFQGVNSAQVQLVLPNPSDELFSSSASQASAAVLLNTAQTPSSGSVKAMAQMVSDSVPALTVSKVTITDQNGDLLWPNAQSANGSPTLLAKEQQEQSYNQQTAAQVDGMLASTLGAGKAQVQVNADLNANQTTEDSVSYAKRGTPLATNTTAESLNGSGAATGGAAGNSSTQIPAYAGAGNGNSKYSNKSAQTTYGVNKTVAHTTVAPGAINRQSVSLMLSSSVPKSEVAGIEKTVEQAVGFVPKRDTIAVTQLAFAKQPVAAPAASSTKSMMGYVKYALVGFAALLFLLFVTRALRKRENETFAQPTWLRELDSPRPLAELEAELNHPVRVAQLKPPVNMARQQVEDLAEREPDRVASQLRVWLTED